MTATLEALEDDASELELLLLLLEETLVKELLEDGVRDLPLEAEDTLLNLLLELLVVIEVKLLDLLVDTEDELFTGAVLETAALLVAFVMDETADAIRLLVCTLVATELDVIAAGLLLVFADPKLAGAEPPPPPQALKIKIILSEARLFVMLE